MLQNFNDYVTIEAKNLLKRRDKNVSPRCSLSITRWIKCIHIVVLCKVKTQFFRHTGVSI